MSVHIDVRHLPKGTRGPMRCLSVWIGRDRLGKVRVRLFRQRYKAMD